MTRPTPRPTAAVLLRCVAPVALGCPAGLMATRAGRCPKHRRLCQGGASGPSLRWG